MFDTRMARRDRIEEEADDLYGRLYCEEEDRQRAEWMEEFDSIPFTPNGPAIHSVVTRRMDAMRD